MKPPSTVVWVTRDSDVDGVLEDAVDVWSTLPMRIPLDAGAFWVTDEWSVATRIGRWSLRKCWGKYRTAPDDDRQVIRVERGPSHKAEAELIELVWTGEPRWYAVRGHVESKDAAVAIVSRGVDVALLTGPRYQWARWHETDQGVIMRLQKEPGEGAEPVTVYYPKIAAPPNE